MFTVHVEIVDGQRLPCGRPAELAIHVGDPCIVEHGGLSDFARVLLLTETPYEVTGVASARLVRQATLQDQAKARENELMTRMARKSCTAAAKKFALNLRLVRIRYSFDRQTLVILFVAEERVDFREMVKALSTELRVRVEMRQIGVRDEAAMVGGLGSCGRTMCCCSWLRTFESINVKMAKTQRLSLNPASISGMCGRLKCCLRYENECYRDLNSHLPRDGAIVQTPQGAGRVLDKNVLKQMVTVQMEDARVLVFKACELKGLGHGGGGAEDGDGEEEVPESLRDAKESYL